MRMWGVDPGWMCRKHLLGAHVETHMILGVMKKKKNILGFIEKRLIDPITLYREHEGLVNEMLFRGYKHNSPLTYIESHNVVSDYIDFVKKELAWHKEWKALDVAKNTKDLIDRCKECHLNYVLLCMEGETFLKMKHIEEKRKTEAQFLESKI